MNGLVRARLRRSPRLHWLLAAVALAMLAGCGLRDPYLERSETSRSPSARPAVASTSSTPTTATTTSAAASDDDADADPAPSASQSLPPAEAGAPRSARNIVYRFALAYANISSATLARRLRTLTSLATPAYAEELRGSAARSEFEALRGLPHGFRVVASVVDIELSPPQGSFENASVTLEQALTPAAGEGEQPFAGAFVVDLLHAGGAWRVADFGAGAQP